MKDSKKFFNDKTVTSLLYTLAVLVVLSVIIVTVAAFASRRGEESVVTSTTSLRNDPKLTTTLTTKPTVTKPSTTTTTTTTKKTTTTKPKTDPEPDTDVSADPIELDMPIEGVLSKAHDSENLSYSMTMNDYRAHIGVDIAADEGSAVLAAEDGTVVAVYEDHLMGKCVEIDHGSNIRTVYRNLAAELPEDILEGAKVKCGQVIGAVGSSAIIEQADETHLHFELLFDGEAMNPLDYIEVTEETFAPSYEDE